MLLKPEDMHEEGGTVMVETLHQSTCASIEYADKSPISSAYNELTIGGTDNL